MISLTFVADWLGVGISRSVIGRGDGGGVLVIIPRASIGCKYEELVFLEVQSGPSSFNKQHMKYKQANSKILFL